MYIIDRLIKYKANFRVEREGSRTWIVTMGVRQEIPTTYESGKGYHLVNMLRDEVEGYVRGGGVVRKYSDDVVSAVRGIDGSYRGRGVVQAVGIDIANCYWTTAYIMGYMSPKLYKGGLKKGKEWKIGRVASIGSLSKVRVVQEYRMGVCVESYTEEVYRGLGVVRDSIVGCVNSFMSELLECAGAIMYLTDCCYVEKGFEEEFIAAFTGAGYDTHVSEGELIFGADRVDMRGFGKKYLMF